MTTQPELPFSGETLKRAGMNLAAESAEADSWGWNDAAFSFLLAFIATRDGVFMAEEVREASKNIVPEPPSKRAWGGIIHRAAHARLIRKVGYGTVKNPKAHCANASVWQAVKNFSDNVI